MRVVKLLLFKKGMYGANIFSKIFNSLEVVELWLWKVWVLWVLPGSYRLLSINSYTTRDGE